MDAGAKEGLTHIYIAEARDDPLIKQQQLDRRGPPCEPLSKLARIEVHRLRPQRLECRPILELRRRHQVERPEAAGIVERAPSPLAGLDDEMIVLEGLAGVDPPMPRHAEVEH